MSIFKSISGRFGFFILCLFLFIALTSQWLAPFAGETVFAEAYRKPPVWVNGSDSRFLLGTDDIGRDVLSRLIHATPISMGIGFFVVIFSTIVGTLLGLIAGSLGGKIDILLSRCIDILLALPSMLMAIIIVAVLGASLTNTIIAVSIVALPGVFRLVRSSVQAENNKAYVLAARSYGANWFRVYFINVLPNCTAPLIVQSALGFSDGILNAAALGFLGLGVQAPTPEWGAMLADARSSIESLPWMVTLPGLCIFLVVIGFNLLGDTLRDHFDPKR